MLSFSLVAEVLTGLICLRPSGENFLFGVGCSPSRSGQNEARTKMAEGRSKLEQKLNMEEVVKKSATFSTNFKMHDRWN